VKDSGTPFLGSLLAKAANIRPVRKGLPGSNALGYMASISMMKLKEFYKINTRGPAPRYR